jgi:hypothetical protein
MLAQKERESGEYESLTLNRQSLIETRSGVLSVMAWTTPDEGKNDFPSV